jgi:hypothetical protein
MQNRQGILRGPGGMWRYRSTPGDRR